MDTEHIFQKHVSTPQKARLHRSVEVLNHSLVYSPGGTRRTKRQLFKDQGIPPTTAYRILKQPDPRRLHNSKTRKETRGRKSKLSERDLRSVELLLWRSGYDGRVLSWGTLAFESGLDVSGHTLQRHFKTLNYRRCMACRKGWTNSKDAATRVKFAKEMLAKYPNLDDWKNIRFTDECHLGYGPAGRIFITRRPGEGTCPDCTQYKNEPHKRDKKKIHVWSAVGFNYKSKLYRYTTGKSNGAITAKVYLDLLKREVPMWPKEMVLEEDNAPGHGVAKDSIVNRWKRDNNVKSYYNCAYSPDLAPIENCWRAPKAWLRKIGHWDDDSVWEVANEGWNALTQKKVNEWCLSMPQRLRDVIKAEGQMTAW
jgi:hypothetical protein